MIRIMYANHCANNDYISNLYENKMTRLGGKFQKSFSITSVLFNVLSIDKYIIFPLFHFLKNERLVKRPWRTFTKIVFMN
jgi:CRISPR/Cas system CSM-associated protein Csm4 (group 5 of RAMP superfamily)